MRAQHAQVSLPWKPSSRPLLHTSMTPPDDILAFSAFPPRDLAADLVQQLGTSV